MDGLSLIDTLLLVVGVLILVTVPMIVAAQARQRRLNRRIAGLHDVANRGVPVVAPTTQPVRITLGQPEGQWPALRKAVSVCFGYDRRVAEAKGAVVPRAIVAGLAAAVAAGWLAGPFAGLPFTVMIVAAIGGSMLGSRFIFSSTRRALVGRLLDQFPDAIGLIVRAVRAGVPVTEGIRIVSAEMPAPVGPEFKRVIDELSVGVDLETALWSLAARTSLPEYRFFVVTIVLQRETGGNLTETLDNLADVIRKRRAVRQRAHALSAEARTSTYVLAALPFVTGVGLYLTNPDYLTRLFTTSDGKLMLIAAAVSLAAGLGTMSMLIRKALS
jgi:tight adherence protein B